MHEGLVRSTWKVEGYVKEVYGFRICFDGDFEAIGLKNFTNFLLCLFNFLFNFSSSSSKIAKITSKSSPHTNISSDSSAILFSAVHLRDHVIGAFKF